MKFINVWLAQREDKQAQVKFFFFHIISIFFAIAFDQNFRTLQLNSMLISLWKKACLD